MSRFKNETQRGGTYIHECQCGSHLLRVHKDNDESYGGPYHTLEFIGFGSQLYNTNLWDRIKFAWRVLRRKEYVDADVIVMPSQAQALGEAIMELAGHDEDRARIQAMSEEEVDAYLMGCGFNVSDVSKGIKETLDRAIAQAKEEKE